MSSETRRSWTKGIFTLQSLASGTLYQKVACAEWYNVREILALDITRPLIISGTGMVNHRHVAETAFL